jgi:hypothetical protein
MPGNTLGINHLFFIREEYRALDAAQVIVQREGEKYFC